MALLRDGVDRSVIVLWLGHESIETTQVYLHADMRLKEQALARSMPSGLAPGTGPAMRSSPSWSAYDYPSSGTPPNQSPAALLGSARHVQGCTTRRVGIIRRSE